MPKTEYLPKQNFSIAVFKSFWYFSRPVTRYARILEFFLRYLREDKEFCTDIDQYIADL